MTRSRRKPAEPAELEFAHVKRNATMLASGRPVAPGERVTLTAEEADDPHNKGLIDDGVLLHLPARTSKPVSEAAPAAETTTEGSES